MQKIKFLLLLVVLSGLDLTVHGQSEKQARWIWYPGDFEVWLHTDVGGKRQERQEPYPPFWRVDSPYGLIRFEKSFELAEPETIRIFTDGRCMIRLDGVVAYQYDPMNFRLPVGKHSLSVLVENYRTFPSLLIQGKTVMTDGSWSTTNQNNVFYEPASGKFTDPAFPPSTFHLEYKPVESKIVERTDHSMLVDFGRETFGKVVAGNVRGTGTLKLYYGETRQEALAETLAETYDYLDIRSQSSTNDTTPARAFRYVYAVWDKAVELGSVSALYEYLPVEYKGTFACSDTLLNRIYDVSLYTLHLNTREFHLDGIKRDRWVWSGDAYQSYLMNFYTFFDEDVNKRTLYALFGHEPVERHINTILDYFFYWMIGIYDHFLYTGDTAFVRQIYPRTKSLMEFCLGRTNANGFAEGLPGDWVFIDWAPIDKEGEVSFQQLLLARSLEAVAMSADLAGDRAYAAKCRKLSSETRKKVFDVFWDDNKSALVHNRKKGILSDKVTRYANMFAVLFDYVDDEKKQMIKDHVILNDSILQITTPYMKFYELASLCAIGEQKKAIEFVKDYWGGMLKLGATSVWEAFDPKQSGDEHYAMYGRPFGKSLCHAWGANPVYLFGKYLLGVRPTAPGYQAYVVEPSLAGLEWVEGKVPTPHGNIEIRMNRKEIRVTPVKGQGTLVIKSAKVPEAGAGVKINSAGNQKYEIELTDPGREYKIRYWPAE
ncbi:MAG: alpha-L-rhamnosidase C-terminal domain-containing protein [Mangrovibacterium sp.]